MIKSAILFLQREEHEIVAHQLRVGRPTREHLVVLEPSHFRDGLRLNRTLDRVRTVGRQLNRLRLVDELGCKICRFVWEDKRYFS